jgi:hypothetical protein
MNALQRLSRTIIERSFHAAVWTIEKFHDPAPYEQKARELQAMPTGTVGHDIGNCLRENGLRLVPNYESHDLKHILLDYRMTPVDEIRLQAFMLGNGNYTIPSFAIFIFGALLLPDLWTTFYQDFSKGRTAKPISTWTIEAYAQHQTANLRSSLLTHSLVRNPLISTAAMAKLGAYTAIILGIFGMLFCLPFLFSASMADLVGAGFPFVGGSIIASAGLIALSNLARHSKPAQNPAA